MWVRYDSLTVRVFDDNLAEVALHPKINRGQYSTLRTHIPKEKINMGEYGSDYLIRKAYNIGPQCAIWGEIMLKNRGLPGIRVLQGLLSLRKKYSSVELNHAAMLGSAKVQAINPLRRKPTGIIGSSPVNQKNGCISGTDTRCF